MTGDPLGKRSTHPWFASTTGALVPSCTVYPIVPATSSPISSTGGPKNLSKVKYSKKCPLRFRQHSCVFRKENVSKQEWLVVYVSRNLHLLKVAGKCWVVIISRKIVLQWVNFHLYHKNSKFITYFWHYRNASRKGLSNGQRMCQSLYWRPLSRF